MMFTSKASKGIADIIRVPQCCEKETMQLWFFNYLNFDFHHLHSCMEEARQVSVSFLLESLAEYLYSLTFLLTKTW